MQNSANSEGYGVEHVQDQSNFVRKNCDQESLLHSENQCSNDVIKASHSVIDMNLSKQRQNVAKNKGIFSKFHLYLRYYMTKQNGIFTESMFTYCLL